MFADEKRVREPIRGLQGEEDSIGRVAGNNDNSKVSSVVSAKETKEANVRRLSRFGEKHPSKLRSAFIDDATMGTQKRASTINKETVHSILLRVVGWTRNLHVRMNRARHCFIGYTGIS